MRLANPLHKRAVHPRTRFCPRTMTWKLHSQEQQKEDGRDCDGCHVTEVGREEWDEHTGLILARVLTPWVVRDVQVSVWVPPSGQWYKVRSWMCKCFEDEGEAPAVCFPQPQYSGPLTWPLVMSSYSGSRY